jgi:uncharacterized protein (DUF305 family)
MTDATDEVDAVDDVERVEDGDEALEPRRGVSLPVVLFLVVACMVLAAAVTYRWDHRGPSFGAVDVGFFDDMTTHHLQAIDLATVYTRYGNDPVLLGDSSKIIFTQAGDIRQMRRALGEWRRSGTPDVAMEWMGMSSPQNAQPGMATPEQVAALSRARGRRLDDLYSALMINHHAGGLHMAEYAEDHAKTSLARSLARVMERDQRFEIADMNLYRQKLGLPVHRPGAPVVISEPSATSSGE